VLELADGSQNIERELIVAFACPRCDARTEVLKPLYDTSYEEAACPSCKQLRRVETTHTIDGREPFLDRTLAEVGFPPLHVIAARNATDYRYYELTGDAAEFFAFR
jgi:hypothetical protein